MTYFPSDLQPAQLTAIVDTREQLPLDLSPLRVVTGTLQTGDYSILGLESIVAVERKSLSDCLGCIGQQRERFEKEIVRLLAYPTRALVIESSWPEIEAGNWRSQVTPAAALGSLLGWIAMGLPVAMVGDHGRAGRYVSRLLYIAARRRWRECRELAGFVVRRARPAPAAPPVGDIGGVPEAANGTCTHIPAEASL